VCVYVCVWGGGGGKDDKAVFEVQKFSSTEPLEDSTTFQQVAGYITSVIWGI
jgi:hypothetical protein